MYKICNSTSTDNGSYKRYSKKCSCDCFVVSSFIITQYSIVYTMLYCAILHTVQGNVLSNPSDPVYM